MKILIITSLCGSGHLVAAEAKRLEILSSHPEATFVVKDMLSDFHAKWLGRLAVYLWNQQQRNGSPLSLRFWSSLLWANNGLFYLPVLYRIYRLIMEENFDVIIDTQGSGTRAALSALFLARLQNKGPQWIDKYIVELPTKDTTYAFASLRTLGKSLRNLLRLHTIEPLLEKTSTPEAFWDKYTKVPLPQILHGTPLRPHFLRPISWDPIQKYTGLSPHVHLTTIMLGSQPTPLSIMSYVQSWINHYKDKEGCYALVVLCCQDHLLKETIGKLTPPTHLTLIPFSQAGDDLVAPLLKFSQTTITRSGGVTSHELLAVAEGQILIHSEAPPHRIMKGMPIWEEGNARYLIKHKKARVVTPLNSQQGHAIFS
ncbi:MAG: hypothetical protein KBC64_01890 [Simkaniaceae bacterium]|nr:hypothetical protein [Simkaniaceae bacterium]